MSCSKLIHIDSKYKCWAMTIGPYPNKTPNSLRKGRSGFKLIHIDSKYYHPSAAQPIAKNDPNPLRTGRKESKPEPMGSTKLKTQVTKALGQPHCDGSRGGRRRWTATTTPRQAHQEEGSQEQSSLRFIQREGPQVHKKSCFLPSYIGRSLVKFELNRTRNLMIFFLVL